MAPYLLCVVCGDVISIAARPLPLFICDEVSDE